MTAAARLPRPPDPRLPESAPFPPEAVAHLNRILGPATPAQRAWLAGFLAGVESIQAPAAPAQAQRPKLTILFATESGNSEALALGARRDAARLGFAVRVLDAAEATPTALAGAGSLLVIASTWGEGEAPQRATGFLRALHADDAPRLDGLRFAVLALGDRAYTQFCETGRSIDLRLEALGATRAAPRLDCDLDYEAPAAAWLGTTLTGLRGADAEEAAPSVIHVEFGGPAPATKTAPFAAEITELVNLNSSRSGKQTFHVALNLESSGLSYEPGDAIGVVPQNDPALVDHLLRAASVPPDDATVAALCSRHDLTTLTGHLVRQLAETTGDAGLQALAADADALAGYVGGRHVIDLLHDHPVRLAPEQLLAVLRPLAPRLYSVASSLRAAPDEAHLLVSAVRYDAHGRTRGGVASTFIADRRRVGDTVPVYVKANPHFRLPADPSVPLIMVGPGTGVAPFRAFMQDRDATGGGGRSWLFFGDRQYTHDFLYQLDWQDWLARGVLTRLDVAFSRDQARKRYVQHAMLDRAAELHAWIKDGARIYVCGDQVHMARDVHAALRTIIGEYGGFAPDRAEAELDAMRAQGRYLQDVY